MATASTLLGFGVSSIAEDLHGFWAEIRPGVYALASLGLLLLALVVVGWVLVLWMLRIAGHLWPRSIRTARRLFGGRPRIRLGAFGVDQGIAPMLDGWVIRLEELRRARERRLGNQDMRAMTEVPAGFDFTTVLSQSASPAGLAAMLALTLRYFLPFDLFTVSGHLHDGRPARATLVIDHGRFGAPSCRFGARSGPARCSSGASR